MYEFVIEMRIMIDDPYLAFQKCKDFLVVCVDKLMICVMENAYELLIHVLDSKCDWFLTIQVLT